LVEPTLRGDVARLEGDLRLPAEYHFGWVEADGRPIEGSAGKGIRQTLAVLGAEAAGGSWIDAVPAASSVELIHNFSLLHDDIIDGDRERRHRPTVWAQYSVGEAIIVGDAMHALAFQILHEIGTDAGTQVARMLGDATSDMIRGQSNDMGFSKRTDITLADCLSMETDKTGALLAFAVASGAVLAGCDRTMLQGLLRYGHELGLAFQAQDDLLGVWGDPAVTGKAAGNDLRERKRSMPVVVVLAAGGEPARALLAVFEREDIDDAAVRAGVAILDATDAHRQTAEIAQTHLNRAIAALDSLDLVASAGAELVELARFVVTRDH